MTRSFGLDAPSALEALKSAVEKFKDDDLNEDLARECALKAWHLCDHVFNEFGSNCQFSSLRGFQDHIKLKCPEFAYLQDICNETKHAKITKYQPHIDEARFHYGDFSRDDFSHDFDISCLEIKHHDGRTFLFNNVVVTTVNFWFEILREQRNKMTLSIARTLSAMGLK